MALVGSKVELQQKKSNNSSAGVQVCNAALFHEQWVPISEQTHVALLPCRIWSNKLHVPSSYFSSLTSGQHMQAVWNKKVFKIRGEPYFMKLRAFTSNNVSEQSTATKTRKSATAQKFTKSRENAKTAKTPCCFLVCSCFRLSKFLVLFAHQISQRTRKLCKKILKTRRLENAKCENGVLVFPAFVCSRCAPVLHDAVVVSFAHARHWHSQMQTYRRIQKVSRQKLPTRSGEPGCPSDLDGGVGPKLGRQYIKAFWIESCESCAQDRRVVSLLPLRTQRQKISNK